jgi:hypothetical protein
MTGTREARGNAAYDPPMETPLAVRNGGRAGLAALAAILLLGAGLRLDYAWSGRAPVFDATAYGTIARNLDADRGFTLGRAATQPADNYSPGLPLFVAGLYKLSGGPHERFARTVLALIGSLSVLFAYLIGRRLSGPAAGLIGAAAVAIYPALLEYGGMLMSEPLAAALLSGAVLAMSWADDARREFQASGSCRGGRGALRARASSTPLPRGPPGPGGGGGGGGRPGGGAAPPPPPPPPPARPVAASRPVARSLGAGPAGVPRRRLAAWAGGAREGNSGRLA